MTNRISYLFVLMLFFMASCTQSTTDSETTMDETEAPEKAYTVTPFPGATEFPDASIESFSYVDNKFSFKLGEGSYELGVQTPDVAQRMCANSGKGQHIHLILNNEPYSAQYTADFEYPIEDGNYHMLAFLSRSYHESIKTDAAHVACMMSVEGGTMNANKPILDPMLFYSRPKGTYIGEAETKKVLLDFYPVNVTLGPNYKVKVDINGKQTELLDVWQPYAIEGLPMGENSITLTLVNGAGNTVPAPFNPVTRKFTLQADPIEQ
ncbi:MAG: hypothetical protein KDC34_00040 [Saprospiraceae bacterium]|nr:hypothetical protein [Saprospiraceae bacterium]